MGRYDFPVVNYETIKGQDEDMVISPMTGSLSVSNLIILPRCPAFIVPTIQTESPIAVATKHMV